MSVLSNHSDDDQFAPSADDQAEFQTYIAERDEQERADFDRFLDDMATYYCDEAVAEQLADTYALGDAA